MLTDTTVNKLNEMKLTTMSRVFREQLTDPNISKLSFEDRFGLLVDQEWTSRKNNHLKRLIKKAKFAEYDACRRRSSLSMTPVPRILNTTPTATLTRHR